MKTHEEKLKHQDRVKRAIFIWCTILILIALLYISKKNNPEPEAPKGYIEEISDKELKEVELGERNLP